MLTFFAVTKTGTSPFSLQRVRVQKDVQKQLSDLFESQALEFLGADVEPLEFSATYTIGPEDDEVFAIQDFELPGFLSEVVAAHQGIPDLQSPFKTSAPLVKAIVGVDVAAKSFFFQYFERRRILDSRLLLIFRNNVFNSVEEPAVTVDSRLAATIVGDELRFKSFHRVRQFLDLSVVFQEATNDRVEQVLQHQKLYCETPSTTMDRMSNRLRKRFAVLIATGILDEEKITPELIQSRAKRYTGLEGIRLRGPAGSRQLVLPEQSSVLEKLIRFMCEEIYVGDLTGLERIANSSRPLSRA